LNGPVKTLQPKGQLVAHLVGTPSGLINTARLNGSISDDILVIKQQFKIPLNSQDERSDGRDFIVHFL